MQEIDVFIKSNNDQLNLIVITFSKLFPSWDNYVFITSVQIISFFMYNFQKTLSD